MAKSDIASRRKCLSILRILHEHGRPMGAARIAQELAQQGVTQSERMVRIYLDRLDELGLTENHGRPGRAITRQGISELSREPVIDKVGFVNARADALAYQMTMDMATQTGTLVVNVSMIPTRELAVAIRAMEAVFARGFGMGRLVAFGRPGQVFAGQKVPEDSVMMATVCSLTVNGIFLKAGVPTQSVFGGLLEMQDGQPVRFAHIIRYDGTTIDPVEIFIQGAMTSVSRATRARHGFIGVGFREVPSSARTRVLDLRQQLNECGLDGILVVGDPNQPVLDIPVTYGRMGVVLAAGLNPIAAVHECGIHTRNVAMCALIDRREMVDYSELKGLL